MNSAQHRLGICSGLLQKRVLHDPQSSVFLPLSKQLLAEWLVASGGLTFECLTAPTRRQNLRRWDNSTGH